MRYALEVLDRGGTVNLQRDDDGPPAVSAADPPRRRLLDATRLSSNKIQVRPARSISCRSSRHAVEALRPEVDAAGHAFAIHLPDGPVWVDADADRLAQVVTNLVSNAARYTPTGGHVDVVVDEAADGVASRCPTPASGCGPATWTASSRCSRRSAVRAAAGSASAWPSCGASSNATADASRPPATDSATAAGFASSLPIAAAPAQAVNGTPTALAGKVRRVLVVDDNVDAATIMGMLLELHGHTVCIAHDAQGALDVARASVPDVALLDIGLPGVDGYELARRLRQHDATHQCGWSR